MCGFAGFLSFGRSSLDAAARHRVLVAMGDAIAHRGPDDAQYFDDGALSLVYRRLSIIDLAGGRQPIFNESGDRLIVVNGEIYNHAALRAELRSRHTFSTRSDSEPPLHAFEEWGASALERLHGMFALAVWNLRDKRLTLARDRLGIKPLYVCRLPRGLLFGSELKALLAHPDCPRGIDWSCVDRPAISQQPGSSYVKGVELIPGGELIEADAGANVTRRRYWQLADHLGAAPYGDDAARYSAEYANLLEQVTLEHLQRDVGAGLHLSGGVDSSLLAGIIAKRERDLPCFTVVERSNYFGGDVDAAGRLTRHLGLSWVPVRFDYRSVVDEMAFDLARFEEAVWLMDSPRIEIEWLFKEQLHRLVRQRHPEIKVVLIGQGADEFAGGYSRPLHALRSSWDEYLRDEVEPNLVFEHALAGQGANQLWQVLSSRCLAQQPASRYHHMMLLYERQLQHHNLWHEDRTSSWNSLEARVPFLDHRLVELLASVPEALHEPLFWDKRIVRDALHRFLPAHEIRHPKIGFLDSQDATSHDVIIDRMLRRTVDEFRQKYLLDGGLPFDPIKVDALIAQALSRGPQRGQARGQLLQCMAVSVFERQCRDGFHGARAAGASSPTLHVMAASEWDAWDSAMKARPMCVRNWTLQDRVVLRKGVQLLIQAVSKGQRYCFVIDGVVAGEIGVAQSHPWLETFLRNLPSEVTRRFTVQDWLEEFEIEDGQFMEVLNILFHQGVLADEDQAEAKAAADDRGGDEMLQALRRASTETVQ